MRTVLVLVSLCLAVTPALGDEFSDALEGLGSKSRKQIQASIAELAELGDARAVPALAALLDRRLRVDEEGRLYILDEEGDSLREALGEAVSGRDPGDLRKPRINNAVRRAAKPVLGRLQLASPDVEVRRSAAEELRKRPPKGGEVFLREALARESDAEVHAKLGNALAQLELASDDPALRREAVLLIGELEDRDLAAELRALLERDEQGDYAEPDPGVREAAEHALAAIERAEIFRAAVGHFFYGLSLASILLLAALGLAITFGLMGVINMAHGEMLMLGAYSTVVVQRLFAEYLPAWFDWYMLAAIPAAFVVTGLVGMLLERGVIRFLYGRPLETLLATWGISLLLIQSVRLIFGAQNVEVANPAWLSGGFEIVQGIVLPYSRIAITFFAVAVVGLVWWLLQRTVLGLRVRAVTQNREIAGCVGVSTARVDMWTFALGSAIGGLGGVALSQVGNVGPELGRLYIVDCFMVVVLGGVGKIAGTVVAATGLGVVNKFLEPVSGAVLGKILVLVFVILFIQRRPEGIFALRVRSA